MKSTRRARRRGRAPLPEGERKDRLIQTRVDEDLDEVLRDAAKKQRLTVSQLIRNVLEDTFQLVEDVVVDAQTIGAVVKRDALRVAAAARGEARDPLEGVDAWQEVVLGRDQTCARCRKPLARGESALMGVTADPTQPRPWLCPACGETLRAPARAADRGS
jgi:NMD protein affecting ribosome stability and mRNA decay